MSTINTLMEHMKTALTSGIDSYGAIASSSPTYGGTGDGEDFDGFGVFLTGLNDTIDFSSITLPALLVSFDLFQSGDRVFGDEPLGMSISVSPIVNDFYGSAIEGTQVIENKEAVNVYIDRLNEFMKYVQFPDVVLIARDNSSPISPGGFAPNNDFYVTGTVTLNIEYMEDI